MRVDFEVDLEDVVYIQKRVLARSPSIRRWWWQSIFITSGITGLLIFLIVPGTVEVRFIFGIAATALVAMANPWLIDRGHEQRLRRLCREQFGSGPSWCTVELSRDGIRTTGSGSEVFFTWGQINQLLDTADSIDFFARNGGGVVVRKRRFHSAEEMQKFKSLAQEYLDGWERESVGKSFRGDV